MFSFSCSIGWTYLYNSRSQPRAISKFPEFPDFRSQIRHRSLRSIIDPQISRFSSSRFSSSIYFREAATPEIYVSPRKRAAPWEYRTHFPVSRVYLDTLRKSTAARKQKHNHTQLQTPTLIYFKKTEGGVLRSPSSSPKNILNLQDGWRRECQNSGNFEIG